MGWMNVDTLTDTAHVVLRTIDSKGDSARSCKIVNPSVKNEAIYLQNIQNKGWNYYLPATQVACLQSELCIRRRQLR